MNITDIKNFFSKFSEDYSSIIIFNAGNFTKGCVEEAYGKESEMSRKPLITVVETDKNFAKWAKEYCTQLGSNLLIQGFNYGNPYALEEANVTKYDVAYIVLSNSYGKGNVSDDFFGCVDYFKEKNCLDKLHIVVSSSDTKHTIENNTKINPDNIHIPSFNAGRNAARAAGIATKFMELFPGLFMAIHCVPEKLQGKRLEETHEEIGKKGIRVLAINYGNNNIIISPSKEDVLNGTIAISGKLENLTEFLVQYQQK